MMEFFSGFLMGAPFWMGLLYLLTHPDQRKALGSRLHGISARLKALFAKTPLPPAA